MGKAHAIAAVWGRVGTMKLYRGIKAREFLSNSAAQSLDLKALWLRLLRRRAQGDLSYPSEWNGEILRAAQLLRLEQQFFTDRKTVAQAYARAEGGLLVEIELPPEEVVRHFRIEFQNFSRRRERFEIVYVVAGAVLAKHARKWKLQVRDA